jgi:hypothetical protein
MKVPYSFDSLEGVLTDILPLILFHVGDPKAIDSLSSTCKRFSEDSEVFSHWRWYRNMPTLKCTERILIRELQNLGLQSRFITYFEELNAVIGPRCIQSWLNFAIVGSDETPHCNKYVRPDKSDGYHRYLD